MKNRSFHVGYIVPIFAICVLMALTFLLPIISLDLSDNTRMNGNQFYEFNINTYDGREIALEDRMKRLAAALEKGEKITYISLADTSGHTAEELCLAVNQEMDRLADLGLGGYSDYFDLDEEHLTEYKRCNMIAGYSSKVWCMKWASMTEQKKTSQTYWSFDVVMDCETQKILAMRCSLSSEVFKVICDLYTADNYAVDLEELSCKWVEYLGFGNVISQEALGFDEATAVAVAGAEDYVDTVAAVDGPLYHFFVGFPDETYTLPASVSFLFPYYAPYGIADSDYEGIEGFPLFFDI